MNAENNFQERAMEYLAGNLDAAGRTELEAYLARNPGARAELETLRLLWEELQGLQAPEPGSGMDTVFYESLRDLDAAETAQARLTSMREWMRTGPRIPGWALAVVLLVAGIAIGAYFFRPSVPPQILTESAPAINGNGVQTILTLLDKPSATDRLEGVSACRGMSEADESVVRALLKTLDTDPNVNVRLAAIEALSHYTDNALVREGLVASIVRQESPLVQISLAELMASLQEPSSVPPIRALIRKEETDTLVRKVLEHSLRQII